MPLKISDGQFYFCTSLFEIKIARIFLQAVYWKYFIFSLHVGQTCTGWHAIYFQHKEWILSVDFFLLRLYFVQEFTSNQLRNRIERSTKESNGSRMWWLREENCTRQKKRLYGLCWRKKRKRRRKNVEKWREEIKVGIDLLALCTRRSRVLSDQTIHVTCVTARVYYSGQSQSTHTIQWTNQSSK